ncbi:hypothetical protein [Mycolicibacterium sp.]|uniref:hypothetical protein n=1 Tax=Mycolicibacterium sp. TaxID=2320850 RepID=UPI0037C9F77D
MPRAFDRLTPVADFDPTQAIEFDAGRFAVQLGDVWGLVFKALTEGIDNAFKELLRALLPDGTPIEEIGFDDLLPLLSAFVSGIPLVDDVIETVNNLLSVIFGGIDFNDLPTPEEVWQHVVTTLIEPLNLLLGPNSPLNALNLFGRIQLPQLAGGLPLSFLTPAVPNLLEPFTAASVPDEDGWSFSDTEDGAQVVADGTLKTLYLKSGVIKVEPDQPVNTAISVKYSGITSAVGQTIKYVLETFTTVDGSGTATPLVVGGITNPSGTNGPVSLGDSSWDIPVGVQSIRPALVVDSAVSAGTVTWLNTPSLTIPVQGLLAGGLPAALTSLWDGIENLVDQLLNALGITGVGSLLDKILDLADEFGDWLLDTQGVAANLDDLLGNLLSDPASVLGTLPQSLISGLLDKLQFITSGGLFDAGKITNVTGTIAQSLVTGLTSSLNALNTFIQNVVDAIISAIRGIPFVGGAIADLVEDVTGLKETADNALSDAATAQSSATTAQQSTDTLSGYFNTPRLIPPWMGSQADDVAFDLDKIDGTATPSLGQILLIPVKVTQDRVYDAIKFGIGATTMTKCYVGLYAADLATGNLTKVIDLGDCKSQLDTAYNQQTIDIPDPVGVQRGELYYIGVLQVGGSAAAMHRSSTTQTFTTGVFPRYRGNIHATGGQTSLPSSIAVADVSSGVRYWGALGTATTPVTPGAVYLSDSFNRANGSLGASWAVRQGSVSISSNKAEGDLFNSGTATHVSRLSSQSQKVGLTGAYANAIILRGNGSGPHVRGYVARTVTDPGQVVRYFGRIETRTAYSGGTTTTRASSEIVGGGSAQMEMTAVGNVYTLYRAGVQVAQWTDSGNVFSVGANNTEVGFYAFTTVDDWYAQDL